MHPFMLEEQRDDDETDDCLAQSVSFMEGLEEVSALPCDVEVGRVPTWVRSEGIGSVSISLSPPSAPPPSYFVLSGL